MTEKDMKLLKRANDKNKHKNRRGHDFKPNLMNVDVIIKSVTIMSRYNNE